MNLYKIIVLHGGPKDRHTSTEEYVIADNDRQVMEYIDINHNYEGWRDSDRMIEVEEGTEITMVDWVLQNKGDLDDEEGWEDAYYGITLWGWDEIATMLPPSDIEVLERLGVAKKIANTP